MTSPSPQERRIVIIGGGIIGCTSAYYLSRHHAFSSSNAHVTLLEASSIAEGASGKAGGLVAKWAYPRELTDISFEEHRRLAKEHGGSERWGWREVACGQWMGHTSENVASAAQAGQHARKKRRSKGGLPLDLDWVEETLTDAYEPMAGPGETAQVHPYQFTTSMLALARDRAGDRLKVIEHARVASIERESVENGKGDKVVGVTYSPVDDDEQPSVHVPADVVVLAAGPWSNTLLPSLPITSIRAHSIVIEPASPVSPYALFTSIRDKASRTTATPEIYARPHNRVYACGPGDDAPLPPLASLVQKSPTAIASLRAQVNAISLPLRDGTVEAEQACYLPLGGPIVGYVDGVKGLVIATGHTCWGICNAPGTGKAVAELVMDGGLSKPWKLENLAPKLLPDRALPVYVPEK